MLFVQWYRSSKPTTYFVIVSDYATLMVEILKDNAWPEAGQVYGAMDMGWAKLVGQIAHAYGK
jgi:hypothetical protein